MATNPFIGHDKLDVDANNPNDVDVPPPSLRRYEKDHCFTIMQLQLPLTLKMEDGPTFLSEDIVPEWLIVPDHLQPLIQEVSGTKYKCGYRISKSLNLQKWNVDTWPLEHRPQEGDWLLCGPKDKTDNEDEVADHFVKMNELASNVFLEDNISGEIFYVARSMHQFLMDAYFFEYMLEQGPIIFTKYVDGISIFGNNTCDIKQHVVVSKKNQQLKLILFQNVLL